jgi:hypothetical protein
MLAALEAAVLYPAILVQLGFATGTAYIWSGVGNLTWEGNTYLGIGTLGTISSTEEGSDIMAKGITLSLSGIDPTLLADALQELQLGQPVVVILLLYSGPGGSIISTPFSVWNGRMDQPEILVSGSSATITLKAESRLLDMNVPGERRLTLEDDNLLTPGDLGMSFVFAIQEANIYWGSAPTSGNNV